MPETISVTFTSDSSKFQQEAAKVIDGIGKVEAATRRARSVGLPIAELTPAALKSMERAAFTSADLARRTTMAGKAGKDGSLGFLAFSQAVEDAQYGIKGVLNNIPQMILGFGGTAGLAGALSLAAVAAYGAYQAFQKFSGINAMEKWAKASTKATQTFTDAIRRNKAETLALQTVTASENGLNASRFSGESAISRGVGIDESYYRGREQEQARIERQRAAMSALLSAGASSDVTLFSQETAFKEGSQEWQDARSKFNNDQARQQGSREWEDARRKFNLGQLKSTQDIAAAQETLNKLSQDYSRITENSGALSVGFQNRKNTALAAEEELRLKLRSLEAEKARAQVEITAPEDSKIKAEQILRRQQELRVTRIQEQIDLRQAELELEQKKIALADDLLAKTQEQADASRKSLADKKAALQTEIEANKESLRVSKQIAELEAKQIQMRALQAQAPALQEAVETARAQQQAVAPLLEDLGLSRASRDGTIPPAAAREAAKGIADQREAERRSKENGLSESDNRKIVQEMRENEEFLRRNSGTVKDRREQRTADRQAARDEQRNERVRSAARQRESRDQNGRQIPDDRIDPAAKAEEAGKRVDDAQGKADSNAAEQLAIQQQIKEAVDELAAKLGTL